MKRLIPVAAALLLPLAAAAAPETYILDPTHTYPNFSVQHLGMSSVYGHFEDVRGKIVLDRVARTGSVEVRVPTSTVATGDALRNDGARSRDEHLRLADFFNAGAFPDMVFTSTQLNFAGDRLQSVDGTLTLLGVARPLTLTATAFTCGANPANKKAMCGGDFSGTLKRSDFGMKAGIPAIGDEVRLLITVEAYKE